MNKFFNVRRTGRKREKPREEKVRERGAGGDPLSHFFSAQDFLAAFLISLNFLVLTSPKGLFAGYKGNKTKLDKKLLNCVLNI